MPSSTMPAGGGVQYGGQWYTTAEWQASGIGSSLNNAGASQMTSTQQSALAILDSQLDTWGLSSLESTALNLIQSGLNEDAVQFQLEQSDAFKQRFAGNAQRAKDGLSVLSPGDYLNTEQAYDQVLRQFGINDTFSNQANYAKLIGNDVSATELQTRAQEGNDLVQNTDPTARNLMSQWYGIGDNDILATFLDPTQAQPGLDKKSYAANVGAAMSRYGLGASQSSAEGLYGTVGQSQAIAGIQSAGALFAKTQSLAQRYGATYTAQDAINQYVLGQQDPANTQQRLVQDEEAQFSRGSSFSSAGAGVSSGGF